MSSNGTCFWCNYDPSEDTHGLSSHATWCPHYRLTATPQPAMLGVPLLATVFRWMANRNQ